MASRILLQLVTPFRSRSSIASVKPVSTVFAFFLPQLPCVASNPFFLSVRTSMRDRLVLRTSSAMGTFCGSKGSPRSLASSASFSRTSFIIRCWALRFSSFIVLLTLENGQLQCRGGRRARWPSSARSRLVPCGR